MNRFACCSVVALLFFIVGCSGGIGDDNNNATGKNGGATTSQQSGLCKIEPGEDVCARSWTNIIAEPDRDKTVATLELVSSFAGAARDSIEILAHACGQMLDDAGIARPPMASSSSSGDDPSARAEAMCKKVTSALREQSRVWTVTVASPSSCKPVTPPACAGRAILREVCSAPQFTVLAKQDDDRVLADAVERNLGTMMQVRSRVEAMASLSSGLTQDLGSVADSPCAPTVAILVTTASSEVSLSMRLSADLMHAIGAPSSGG